MTSNVLCLRGVVSNDVCVLSCLHMFVQFCICLYMFVHVCIGLFMFAHVVKLSSLRAGARRRFFESLLVNSQATKDTRDHSSSSSSKPPGELTSPWGSYPSACASCRVASRIASPPPTPTKPTFCVFNLEIEQKNV